MKSIFIILGILLSAKQALAFGPREVIFDEKVPTQLQDLVREDLNFAFTIVGEKGTPLHLSTFGEVNGLDYRKFFNRHIDIIGVDHCFAMNAIACAGGDFSSKAMWITGAYTKERFNTATRIGFLFHEARHTEYDNANWEHTTCPSKLSVDNTGRKIGEASIRGRTSCDDTAHGAYGVQTTMLSNLAKKCTNCTEKFKTDASMSAESYLTRIIDLDSREKIILDSF